MKRRVTGREHDFFAAVSPGLESLCLNELKIISGPNPEPGKDFAETEGGVEFKGRVTDCFSANLNLRTANRVLMRIGEFKATNFTQLKKKLSGFPWDLYLSPFCAHEINVSAKRSRLYHKEAIAGIFSESIETKLASPGFGEKDRDISSGREIFVRASDDRFIISIDSSGELLYRRGIKTHRTAAPLRETTAAAILMLSGYDGTEPLIDPMCGSGTFSLEAAMIAQNIPAGFFRKFAFYNWPCFEPKRWAYIKRKAESRIKEGSAHKIFASDSDPLACDLLRSCTKKHDLLGVIDVESKNFFDLSVSALTKEKGLVVINPPYGHRIGSRSESVRLFGAVCEKLKKDYSGWKAALIAPHVNVSGKIPLDLKTKNLFHGGLNLCLLYGRID